MTRVIATMIIAVTLLIYPIVGVDAADKHPPILDSIAGLAWTTEPDYVYTFEPTVSNHCSTTSINEKKGYWLTAAHCVTYRGADPNVPWESVTEDHDYQINSHPVRLVFVDVRKDLAVVQTEGYGVKAIKVSKTAPTYEDEITIAGYPLGWARPAITKGRVSSPDQDLKWLSPFLIFQCPIAPGSSGSSVLNKKGQIVSVVQIGWGTSFSAMGGGSTYQNLKEFVTSYLP